MSTWHTYTVTATRAQMRSAFTFKETNETAATFHAMAQILKRAHRHPGSVWALGRIELTRGDQIIHTMPEKG